MGDMARFSESKEVVFLAEYGAILPILGEASNP
jgi:hypothetical protein